jgi:hypothetical protein
MGLPSSRTVEDDSKSINYSARRRTTLYKRSMSIKKSESRVSLLFLRRFIVVKQIKFNLTGLRSVFEK